MHRRLNYSNVIATLALFVALGGSSYAAIKITGRNVVNGSLTGKDIKKRSVPVNRLSSLPKGVKGNAGAPGPKGEQGPAGPVDPSQFVSAAGLYEVAVGPFAWQSLFPGLRRTNPHGGWASTTANDSSTVVLDPALPTNIAGKAMRLRAVTPCWNATTTAAINGLVISTFHENAAGDTTNVVEIEDPADHTEKICKRYAFATPVDLSGGGRVSVRINVSWQAVGATIHFGGATFELDRAP